MSDTPKGEKEDVALVLGVNEESDSVAILRKRDQQLEAAVLRKAEEGQPIRGVLVRLKARETSPLFDVETLYEAPQSEGAARNSSGPAQIASEAYRRGWERVFENRRKLN